MTDTSIQLVDRAVDRAAKKSGTDAFSAVAAAIGSPTFTGAATLGSIWAATPGASGFLLGDWDASWTPPLLAILGVKDTRVGMTLYAEPRVGRRLDLGDFDASRYPRIPAQAVLEDSWGWGHMMDSNWVVATATWTAVESPEEALRGRLGRARAGLFADGLLLPSVNGESDAMHPLMSWWALLFALSIFARYHPTPWVEALDPDHSPLAVPLQALLDVASDAVAGLIWEAVSPEEPEPLTIATSTWKRMSASELAEHDSLLAERDDPFRRRTTT